MKRLLIAAVFAVGLLASGEGQARAQGCGYGCGAPNGPNFGIGIGVGVNFTISCNKGGGGGCLPNNQGFSPYYPPPTPWGGLSYYNPYSFYPTFGSYPFAGHQGGYPLLPTAEPPKPFVGHQGGYPLLPTAEPPKPVGEKYPDKGKPGK
jgi:hypothetical protein